MKRDIARNRMVTHSSAYDKNLCGHLVTSGNPRDHATIPSYKFVEQYKGSNEKFEHLIDEQNITYWCSPHKCTYFDIVFEEPVGIMAYRIYSKLFATDMTPTQWVLSGSNDGVSFTELDYRKYTGEEMRYGEAFEYSYFTPDFILPVENHDLFRIFRLEILNNSGSIYGVAIGEFDLIGTDKKSLLRTYDGHFKQCWKSSGYGEEYLILDLGCESQIDETILDWGEEYALSYDILASNDGEKWEICYSQEEGRGDTETLSLNICARYLKLLMHQSSSGHYILRQWKVMGENNLPMKQSDWHIQRASETSADGNVISLPGFDESDWFPAVVPGTVLTSYMEAGAVCEYNNDDNYKQHSDAFFTTNWWYRTKFNVEKEKEGKRIWLNFDAVNWKADIYLNGKQVGDIKGAFIRSKIDITDNVFFDRENYLAVLVHCNDFPGPQKSVGMDFPYFINGGVTGLDEPCLAATVGWDWIATVSGRNVGIYKDVYLTYSEEVQIHDPWFETDSINYDLGDARITFRTEINNASPENMNILLKCVVENGLYEFSKELSMDAFQRMEVEVEDILINNARLWFPVGYGLPELYKAQIFVYANGKLSDEKEVTFGIRQIDYDIQGESLHLKCNDKRICCVGGNWGMDEANMRDKARDYDIKVRMHADMNFNMIRNWVGQINDEAFYAACDKYGVMVWDDFWLANPVDGPEPLDIDMFMSNAEDKIRKIRNHPCVVIYCARNEGDPVEPLKSLLPELVARFNPKRLYVPHSASGIVSGYGPYRVLEKEFYFENTPNTFHSERGIPNIPVLESVQEFLSLENQWPINDTWVSHAFIYNGAQNCKEYCQRLNRLYGKTDSLEEFVRKSQLICYESYKAIFEAERAVDGGGMLLWMSSSAMPSFAFQTYDYYYAINGGYMGAKLANQPIYAYHNPIAKQIVLDNRTGDVYKQARVTCQLFDISGNLLWEDVTDMEECVSGQETLKVLGDYDETVFLRTTVETAEGKTYGNFEWIYPQNAKTVGLEQLENAKLSLTKLNNQIKVENVGTVPAIQIALSLIEKETKERILPVFWSDNFFSLMPGESYEVTYECYDNIAEEKIDITITGFNFK